MLNLKKINAGYGKLHVLRDVDFEAKQNQIVAIIGPNGAGKSTIIKALFGIADVYSGKLSYKGKDLSSLRTHELINEGIAYMPQGRIVFDTMGVQENLELGCPNLKDKTEINKRLDRVYRQFPELKKKRNHLAYGLSGGQKQMLALGRALMQAPDVILMDEPSLGLSPKLQKELFTMIKRLKALGLTIIIVEQNAKKAIEIADRTYLLENGEVVLFGNKEILQDERIKKVYLGG